jgi:hypothetical protein
MATINYISGNINVSMFPTNANPIWFCDKNTGGINIATNGAAMTTNTINIGNSTTTTNASGILKTNTIQGIDTTGDQSFFTTKTAGNLNVFAVGTAVLNIKGSGLKVDTISTDNLTSNQGIYANKTAGTLSIATSQTSGNINIGGVGSTTTIKGAGQVDTGLTVAGTTNINTTAASTTTMGFASAGTTNIVGTTNINTTTAGNTNIGSSTGGITSIAGSTNISGTTVNINNVTGTTNIGAVGSTTTLASTNIGIGSSGIPDDGYVSIASGTNVGRAYASLGSSSLNYLYLRSKNVEINTEAGTSGNTSIGTTEGGITSISGGKIRQVTPLIGSGTIETVIGNANTLSSLSTTFNRKSQADFGSAIPCYRIVSPEQYNTQYCELVICGANFGLGGYSAKYYFVLEQPASTIVAPTVNLFHGVNRAGGGNPTITFTIESTTTMTLNIDAGMGGSTTQNFISTLIAYPSVNINSGLIDYSITAI